MTQEQLKEAFNKAVKLMMTVPVDTLVFRKSFQKLPVDQQEELLRYIDRRFKRWPTMYAVARHKMLKSEFSSDHYHQTKSRGPYRPAVYKFFAGLMANCL